MKDCNLIKTCRKILKEHQYMKYQKQTIDVQTANVLVTVYDKLSDNNKKDFDKIPLKKLIDFCWKQVRTK